MNVRSWWLMMLLAVMVLVGCSRRPPTREEQARSLFDKEDWDGTVAVCTSILVERSNDVEVLTLRARSYLMLRQHDRAIADFSRVIAVRPDDPEGYYLREIAYRRAGQTELAEADGKAGRSMDPRHKTAYLFETHNFTDTRSLAERVEPAKNADDPREVDDRRGPDNKTSREPDSSNPESTAGADTPPTRSNPAPGLQRRIANRESSTGNQPTAGHKGPVNAGPPPGTEPAEQKPTNGVVAQQPPQGPAEPQAPQQPRAAAGDAAASQDPHKNWQADQQKVPPDKVAVPEADRPDANSTVPALPRPALSTSLPPAGVAQPRMTAAPGIVTPPTTGIISQKTERNRSVANPSVMPKYQPAPTGGGWGPDSLGRPGGLASPTRFVPGQFQGNTLYTPGKPPPPLSTSLPGTTRVVPGSNLPASGVASDGGPTTTQRPVLSTQLPPDRLVRPAPGRSTGINSNKRPTRP